MKDFAVRQGFLQALGVSIYCVLVGLFMWNAGQVMGPVKSFLGPAVIVTLFSVSTLISSLIVFYKPYQLFFAGKKKTAIKTVVYTAAWLFLFLLILLTCLLIQNKVLSH